MRGAESALRPTLPRRKKHFPAATYKQRREALRDSPGGRRESSDVDKSPAGKASGKQNMRAHRLL
jgi:hypothetical protein